MAYTRRAHRLCRPVLPGFASPVSLREEDPGGASLGDVTTAHAEQFAVDAFVREALAGALAAQAGLDASGVEVAMRLQGRPEAAGAVRGEVLVSYRIGGESLRGRQGVVSALSGLSPPAVGEAFAAQLAEVAHSQQLPGLFDATVEAAPDPRLREVPPGALEEPAAPLPLAGAGPGAQLARAARAAGASFCCMMAADVEDTCGTCFPIAAAAAGSECGESRASCLACGGGAAWCASGHSEAEFPGPSAGWGVVAPALAVATLGAACAAAVLLRSRAGRLAGGAQAARPEFPKPTSSVLAGIGSPSPTRPAGPDGSGPAPPPLGVRARSAAPPVRVLAMGGNCIAGAGLPEAALALAEARPGATLALAGGELFQSDTGRHVPRGDVLQITQGRNAPFRDGATACFDAELAAQLPRTLAAAMPMMLRLASWCAAKAQRPLLNRPSADMTAAAANWGVVCDGVSGVAPRFNPEDLSWDLRNCLRFLLRQRFHWAGDEQEFDAQVAREIGGDVRSMAAGAPAVWRKSALTGSYTRLFITGGHHVRIAAASGEVIGPKQVAFLLGVARVGVDLERAAAQADCGAVNLNPRDIIICCSDGIVDNVPYESFKVILTGTDDDVHAAADQMVKCAQLHGAPKPDDISIVIGVVGCAWGLGHALRRGAPSWPAAAALVGATRSRRVPASAGGTLKRQSPNGTCGKDQRASAAGIAEGHVCLVGFRFVQYNWCAGRGLGGEVSSLRRTKREAQGRLQAADLTESCPTSSAPRRAKFSWSVGPRLHDVSVGRSWASRLSLRCPRGAMSQRRAVPMPRVPLEEAESGASLHGASSIERQRTPDPPSFSKAHGPGIPALEAGCSPNIPLPDFHGKLRQAPAAPQPDDEEEPRTAREDAAREKFYYQFPEESEPPEACTVNLSAALPFGMQRQRTPTGSFGGLFDPPLAAGWSDCAKDFRGELRKSAAGDQVVSIGTLGHPHSCSEPCKHRKRKTGCLLGASCPRCHLCHWRSERALAALEQRPAALAPARAQAPPQPPWEMALPAPPQDQPAYVTLCASFGERPGPPCGAEAAPLAELHSEGPPGAVGGGAAGYPSVGSVGHPVACQWPCKYASKSRGCKVGPSCTRCHLCRWTRSVEHAKQILDVSGQARRGLPGPSCA
ncbi:unnamed protein product [Prorocentrum cordatum]|uniref:Protein phosphatase n=1 Tax=Prorocentrum cordatum TaxID=2364126 RepID=A0ABN9SHH8_9DINO|nr:unnamed protein product [Polarella glacialis]